MLILRRVVKLVRYITPCISSGIPPVSTKKLRFRIVVRRQPAIAVVIIAEKSSIGGPRYNPRRGTVVS